MNLEEYEELLDKTNVEMQNAVFYSKRNCLRAVETIFSDFSWHKNIVSLQANLEELLARGIIQEWRIVYTPFNEDFNNVNIKYYWSSYTSVYQIYKYPSQRDFICAYK